MEEVRNPCPPFGVSESTSYRVNGRYYPNGQGICSGSRIQSLKKRGQGSRSWIKIDQNGDSKVLELDKATIMRHCSLPARDLRLLDPLFIYPSTILGREKAIVVNLEQIRCIITAEEVILMNSIDGCVVQYKSELCRRLQSNKEQSGKETYLYNVSFLLAYDSFAPIDDLPFEFRALELALELTCMSLDAQVKALEMEIYPVVDELATSISTHNLERARRLKGQLLTLTQRVQKVHDEMENLMDDDDDMAEMYLTEKKQKSEGHSLSDLGSQTNTLFEAKMVSKSAPVSPVGSISGEYRLQRAFSNVISASRHGSFISSSNGGENIVQLEMLLEAYFVVIGHTLSKLLSLKEYIDDTEDLINIKLGNVQNQLIQFELLITAATFVATIFASVTAVFGMNFEATVFDYPSTFTWVVIISCIFCGCLYFSFVIYFRYKKLFPL